MSTLSVRYEQAVYGSFPFWDRGYAILATSPGCRPEWLTDLRAVCQRYGEQPSSIGASQALLALRLPNGPWAIVGVSPQGVDDRGRPGALAFHALFVTPRDYRRARGNPFDFTPLIRNDWSSETQSLASGTWDLVGSESPTPSSDDNPRAAHIASALARGKRVALQTPEPIDDLAEAVWQHLPPATRGRLSLTTWAFDNGNQFDFAAFPRLSAVTLDSSYLISSEPQGMLVPAIEPSQAPRLQLGSSGWPRLLPWIGVGVVALSLGLGFVWRRSEGEDQRSTSASSELKPTLHPPDRSKYPDEMESPAVRARVLESLQDLHERVDAADGEGPHSLADPGTLMNILSLHLRYHGPVLSAAERERLEAADGPGSEHDRALALKWDRQIRHFLADRPLPDDFASGPLRWQLDTLIWSYHWDNAPFARRRSADEASQGLAEAIRLDIPVLPLGLMEEFATLRSYAEFLKTLPRR